MKAERLIRFSLPGILMFVLVVGNAQAMESSQKLLSALGSDVKDNLADNEMVFRYDEELAGPSFLPDTSSKAEIEALHRSMQPEVMVEALYKVPYPSGLGDDAGEILRLIYNLSHEVSSISGVKYYSWRKKDYSVLFSDVYAVDSIEKKKKTEDPQAEGYLNDSVFLHMKENALGRGYYRMDYMPSDEMLTVKLTNESILGFIITAVEVENMVIYLQIIPCSDAVLIYGYCGVILENDGIVNLMLDPYYAFYRRMTAMETWLYNSLHGTDMLPLLLDPMP